MARLPDFPSIAATVVGARTRVSASRYDGKVVPGSVLRSIRIAGAALLALASGCTTGASAKKAPPSAAKPQAGALPAVTADVFAMIDAEFVRVPAGTLPSAYTIHGKRPAVKVAAFLLAKHEVTQREWTAVMGSNPSKERDDRELPATNVSWRDAHRFITHLNQARGSSAYRLPTAREWEFACRAGTPGHVAMQASESALNQHAWWGKNSGHRSHPVGRLKPNALGLYDMLGNVAEWCETAENPRARDILRVHAGGNFLDENLVGQDCSTTAWLAEDAREESTGFRLARDETAPKSR